MITTKPTDWREYRRFQAFELRQQGWKNSKIAQALGVSKAAVSQWFKRLDEADGDKEVLRHRRPPGLRGRLALHSAGATFAIEVGALCPVFVLMTAHSVPKCRNWLWSVRCAHVWRRAGFSGFGRRSRVGHMPGLRAVSDAR